MQGEKRERDLRELVKKNKRPVALFVDEPGRSMSSSGSRPWSGSGEKRWAHRFSLSMEYGSAKAT
ncbi:hypothetical protein OKW43_008465 [Paraburkholderia sp. WC7.3g]